jgi:hypothetical protein
MRHSLLFLLVIVVAGCGRGAQLPTPASNTTTAHDSLSLAEVASLTGARDYFSLRERLNGLPGDVTSPAISFARAVLHHAFNRPAESNAAIVAALAAGGLPDSLVFRLRDMQVSNHLRLHDYAAGLATANLALAAPPASIDPTLVTDLQNSQRMLAALQGVLPQTVSRNGETRVRFEAGRIPVVMGDSVRSYIFDTGANLSTMMRSEAAALGLELRKTGIEVGTSTDIRVTADLAVVGRLTIGGLEYRNVVFLVLDDALLTFGELRLAGIIGFPVIAEMQEFRMSAAGELSVPQNPPTRTVANLALSGYTALTTVSWEGDRLICQLDTGAGRTHFFEPFFRRHRAAVEGRGQADTLRTGGAGGVRRLPAFVLSDLHLGVGDTTHVLPRAYVITRSIVNSELENYVFCRAGHDILDAFAEYIVNFRDMSFLLR